MILLPNEAFERMQLGQKVEYYDEGWWVLDKDQPIRMLWEYQIRLRDWE